MSAPLASAWNDYVASLLVEDRDPFWWLELPADPDPEDWWRGEGDTEGPLPAWAYEARRPPASLEGSRWATSSAADWDAYLSTPPTPSAEFLAGALEGFRLGIELAGAPPVGTAPGAPDAPAAGAPAAAPAIPSLAVRRRRSA
jgi:hypothetical protein